MPRTKTKAPTSKRQKTTSGAAVLASLTGAPILEVWRAYKKSSSDELRNYLIENYLHLVKSTAERMHMRLPGEVDVEDLMSAGPVRPDGCHRRLRP